MRKQIYWIVGGGYFGRLACERLHRAHPGAHISLVDRKEIAVQSGIEMVVADALEFLADNLKPQTDVWVVPAVPVHLAYEWVADRLRSERAFQAHEVPRRLYPGLPNPCRGPEGQVFLSNADFKCPDDCAAPGSVCTHTGRPRPQIMHAFLADLAYGDYTSHVIRSVQLAPGVGGYKTTALLASFAQLRCETGRFLFSTACKCHGVMHAFSLD